MFVVTLLAVLLGNWGWLDLKLKFELKKDHIHANPLFCVIYDIICIIIWFKFALKPIWIWAPNQSPP